MDAAERLNAVGLAGLGVVAGVEDSSTVAGVEDSSTVAVVETAVASGW